MESFHSIPARMLSSFRLEWNDHSIPAGMECHSTPRGKKYAAWSLYTVADKELQEGVQRRAIRMITNISGTYEQKLTQLGLTSLEENRQRGDMVEMYKMMTGKTKVDYRQLFKLSSARQGAGNTRGRKGYLNVEEPPMANKEVRKNFFTQRCPRVWNTLPDSVKMATTVNGFKAAYDQYKSGSKQIR